MSEHQRVAIPRFGDLTASPGCGNFADSHVDVLFVAVKVHSLAAALDGAASRWLRGAAVVPLLN